MPTGLGTKPFLVIRISAEHLRLGLESAPMRRLVLTNVEGGADEARAVLLITAASIRYVNARGGKIV